MKPLALRNILVATDLGTDMLPALKSAIELAELAGAELHVVHAGEAHAQHQRDRLGKQIEALSAALGQDLEVSLLAGPPAAAITQEAVRTQADVIVLGRHRNRAGSLGSTADRVVRTARVPCLILPVELTLPLASVLVPVDIRSAPGPLSIALTWASALRRRVPHQQGTPTRVEALYVHSDPSANEPELESQLRAEVSAIEQRVAKIAGIGIEHHVDRDENVAAAILQQAEKRDATLLVLGTRGKRITTDPLGSVSSAVTADATRPILLVPPEVWRAEATELV